MMIFEKEYELRGSDFDRYDRIRPAAVLDLFQDVAGIHAIELGVGFHDLIAREMIWVLTKIRYEIVGELRRYERVRVRTWPLPPSRVNCRREYRIEAMDGAVLVNGTSEWVIVHSEKRRVLPAGDVYPAGRTYCTDTAFAPRLAKVASFSPAGEGMTVCPGFSQLDLNGHVNNTKYADYVCDLLALPQEQTITAFAIDYHREVLQGDGLTLYAAETDEGFLLRGMGEEELMFSCGVKVDKKGEDR